MSDFQIQQIYWKFSILVLLNSSGSPLSSSEIRPALSKVLTVCRICKYLLNSCLGILNSVVKSEKDLREESLNKCWNWYIPYSFDFLNRYFPRGDGRSGLEDRGAKLELLVKHPQNLFTSCLSGPIVQLKVRETQSTFFFCSS